MGLGTWWWEDYHLARSLHFVVAPLGWKIWYWLDKLLEYWRWRIDWWTYESHLFRLETDFGDFSLLLTSIFILVTCWFVYWFVSIGTASESLHIRYVPFECDVSHFFFCQVNYLSQKSRHFFCFVTYYCQLPIEAKHLLNHWIQIVTYALIFF
jgi:hypothetical protein